mgnify:CR=1 FL=1
MSRYFDRQGQPIANVITWGWLMNDRTYQRIAETTLPDGKWISTVWIGLNHNDGDGPPLIFESMVFPKKGEYGELDCERYATEAEATIGHTELVKKWSQPQLQETQ